MVTKLVYILVSGNEDYFLEMLMLSLYSLRIYHPDDEVSIVMDTSTSIRLESIHSSLLNDAIHMVVDVPSEYTMMQRSRYIKTRLREILKGDFLYIDCDTIISKKLDDINTIDAEIALVNERSGKLLMHYPSYLHEFCEKAGFPNLEHEKYFNGGVIFAKDTPLVHHFFNEWYVLWKISVKNGVSKDQPALWQTNKNLHHPIKDLPKTWNCCLLDEDRILLGKSKIYHYLNGIVQTKMIKLIFEPIKRKKKLGLIHILIARLPYLLWWLIFFKRDFFIFLFRIKQRIEHICS